MASTLPAAVATTAVVSPTEAPPSTSPQCRDISADLAGYLDGLGLGHLDLAGAETGPLDEALPDGQDFAAELRTDCSGVFFAHSSFGEMAHVVAAWDGAETYAAIGAFVKGGLLPPDDKGLIVDLDRIVTTRLTAVGEEVLWGEVGDWAVAHTLDGIAAVAGTDPITALGAWNRASGEGAIYSMLEMGSSSGWGGDTREYDIYPNGEMIAWVQHGGFPRTFADTRAVYQLSAEQMSEIETMLAATGVIAGERFKLDNQGIVDAGSLWFKYRHEDVTFSASVYAPGSEGETPARQQVIDLREHLDGLLATLDRDVWVPDAFAVWVTPHGPFAESNTMTWPGSFDLAAAAERRCTLLEGEPALAYLDDVAFIGDEYQDRYRTLFEFGDQTYQVIAIALLPGDIDRQFERLPECRTGGAWEPDAALGLWLWGTRGIHDYRMVLQTECSSCDDEVILDGEAGATIPGWGEVRTVENLFAMAMRDDLELLELTTDGFVGVPLTLEVGNPQTDERLRLLATSFVSEQGRLSVGYDEIVGGSLSFTGFEEWIPEGY